MFQLLTQYLDLLESQIDQVICVQGTFVIEYVGEVIDRSECNRRLTRTDGVDPDRACYFLGLAPNRIIDADKFGQNQLIGCFWVIQSIDKSKRLQLSGNISRFINHSCDPNCHTEKWIVDNECRMGLFASKDILAGTFLAD